MPNKAKNIKLTPIPDELLDTQVVNRERISEIAQSAEQYLDPKSDDPAKWNEQIHKTAEKLSEIDDESDLGIIVDEICRKYKIPKKLFQEKILNIKKRVAPAENIIIGLNRWSQVENIICGKYDIRHNVVANVIEYRKKGEDEAFVELNEDDIFRELNLQSIYFAQSNLQAMLRSNFVKEFNPFEDYFQSLPKWDIKGKNYIKSFSEYITTEDTEWFYKMLLKWMVRSVRCALESGQLSINKNALVLVSKKQNSGKSTWCRYLCPPALSNYIDERLGTDKDSLIALSRNFIINLDELSTLNKTDIQQLKSFFSLPTVRARPPYGKRVVTKPRVSNFVGSTDRPEFLSDEAGNVRWICIEVEKIDFKYTSIPIDKLWSQAFYLYTQKNDFGNLTIEEIEKSERINKKFIIKSIEMEMIDQFFRPPKNSDIEDEKITKIITASQICKIFKEQGYDKFLPNNVGKGMALLGFQKRPKRINSTSSIWGWAIVQRNNKIVLDMEEEIDIKKELPF